MHRRASHVVVLGGGIAGLSAAHTLRNSLRNTKITLLESSSRFGGWLWSERIEGFLFERGCRGIRPSGPGGQESIAMIEELGIQRQAIVASPAAASRFIWQGPKKGLEKLPNSFIQGIRSPLTMSAPLWAVRDIFATPGPASVSAISGNCASENADESVSAFAQRHFGTHVARVLLDAALGGIHAGDIDKLSARSVLPMLWEAEIQGTWAGGRAASVLLGLYRKRQIDVAAKVNDNTNTSSLSPFATAAATAASLSFIDGVGALPAALISSLCEGDKPAVLLKDSPISALLPSPHGVHIVLESGASLEADAVVCALPASDLATILLRSLSSKGTNVSDDIATMSAAASTASTASAAASQTRASVGVVSMAWRHAPPGLWSPGPAHAHSGFGYLVPRQARARGTPPILGMTFDSTVFPGQSDAWSSSCLKKSTNTTPSTSNNSTIIGPGTAADVPIAIADSETRITVMMGGAGAAADGAHVTNMSQEELVACALNAAREQAGVGAGGPPHTVRASIAHNAIPQYNVGHSIRETAVRVGIQTSFSGRVELAGNSWGGIGAADAIRSGRIAARNVVARLTRNQSVIT